VLQITHPRPVARALALLLLLTATLAAASCDRGSGGAGPPASGTPRSVMFGFSSLPRELNAEAYAQAIDFASEHGEIVLIQRNVPWAQFVPGGSLGDDLAEQTNSERDAVRDEDLKLFFALDPTDGATGRDRLSELPESLAGRRFDDADVRSAFRSYAEYVAINYQPEYLALGVEMNLYYEKNKDDWENFLSLYLETYAAVKAASPATQITVTMQYEDLQGILPREDTHFVDWQLLRAFDPIDFIGISTYPGFAFQDPTQIPRDYYLQLTAFTEKPIAIAEMGYASREQPGVISGSEEHQSAYLERALAEAEELSMPFAIWFAIWDPAYARGTEFGAFEHIGLLRSDDSQKPAWSAWDEAARRPYRAPPTP
jgi:hypothetical protein